jgi:DNA-binding NarL/FixJ family response regulator
MSKIRIVIADDHPIFSRGLRQILMGDATFEVVVEAQDGATALQEIEQQRPDVAVLDIDMPIKDGFDVVRAMGERKLSSAVVFLTMHKDEELFDGAMNLGVRGYVLKESAFSELVDSHQSRCGRPALCKSDVIHFSFEPAESPSGRQGGVAGPERAHCGRAARTPAHCGRHEHERRRSRALPEYSDC